MDAAAKKWIQEYKKLFDQVAARNAGNSVATDLAPSEKVKTITRLGKIVEDTDNSPKRIVKLGKLAENEQKDALTNMNQENMKVSERDALDIDSYTEKEYNNYGWARDNGVLSASENARLRSMFAEAVSGRSKPPKSKSNEYMIAVGDKVDNKIVYMKGTIDNPIITRVLEIKLNDETRIDEIRRETYALERRGIQQEAGGIFNTYSAASFGGSDYQQRSGIRSERYNDQFGTQRRRSRKEPSKVKEILFDDNGNEVNREYRYALADGRRATAGEVAAVKSSISKKGIDPKGIIAIADKYFARYSGQLTRNGVRYEFLAAADMLFDLTAESGDRAYASVEALAEELVTNEKDKKPPIVSLYYKRSFLFDCGF